MSTAAIDRLRLLPPVFTLAELCRVGAVPQNVGSVMLHRWRARGLVRALSAKIGMYFNLIVAPDWRAHLPSALARAFPTAIEVGESVLLNAGWTTQRAERPAYAILDSGPHAVIDMVLLVDRPAAWYVAVRRGAGVAQGDAGRIIPALTPPWALADALVYGEPLWTPAPDDLYVDDIPAAGFVSAYNALCEVAGTSVERADVRRGAALIDVYDHIYANQHARPVPKAQRRAGMR